MTAIQAPPKKPHAAHSNALQLKEQWDVIAMTATHAQSMQTLQFNYLFSHTRFLTASLTSCPRTLTLCILVRLALSSSGVITDILTPRSSLHLVHLQAICQFVRPLLNHINGKLTLGLTSGLRRIRVVLVQKQMNRNLRDLPFGRAKLHSKRQASRAISFLFCFLFFK